MRTPKGKVFIGICLIAAILTGCLPGASANEYNLIATVNENKLPAAELDNIAYAVREAVEVNHRWNTEWLTYWANAEMVGICGTIKVNNLQEGESTAPLEPINLQDVVSVEAWVEYSSFTESQLLDSTATDPMSKTAKGKLIYKDGGWRVKSVEEMGESLGAYCP